MAIPAFKLIKWACEDVYYTPIINELTQELLKDVKVTLGEKERYRIIDTSGQSYASGLIAILVEDTVDGDKAIIYQGSIGEVIGNPFKRTTRDWMGNNIPNALGMSVAQYKAAETFYLKMVKTHGSISKVSGNSLGGGSAAYVATKHPEVFAISVNGAPMPKKYLKKADKDFDNILNIRGDGDVLSRLCLLLYRGDDYPGTVYMVNRGLLSLDYGSIELSHRGSNMDYLKERPSLDEFMVFDPQTSFPIQLGNGRSLYKASFTELTKEEQRIAGEMLLFKSNEVGKDLIAGLKKRIKQASYKKYPFYMHENQVESKVEILLTGIINKFPETIQERTFFKKWMEDVDGILNEDLRRLIVHNTFDHQEMDGYLKELQNYLIRSLEQIIQEIKSMGRLVKGGQPLKERPQQMMSKAEEEAFVYLIDKQILSFQKKLADKNFPRFLKALDGELLSLGGKSYFKKNEDVRGDILKTVKAFKKDVICYLLSEATANDLYYYLEGIPYTLLMFKGLLKNILGHVKKTPDMVNKELLQQRIPPIIESIDNLNKEIKRLL